jgi:glycosyltransferase involved in cell wall biosynthesis
LKIIFVLSGNSTKASSRVRGFWLAEELKKMGSSCTLRWRDSKFALILLLLELVLHDVIIFQKTYSRYHRWLMAYAKYLGKSVYFDIDDAPSRVNNRKTIENFEAMALMANSVFVGSRKLYDYVSGFRGNAKLIPTGIKLTNYDFIGKREIPGPICIGWIGNGSHYEKDLVEILQGPLTKLAGKYDIQLKIVGALGSTTIYESLGAIDGLDAILVDDLDWSDAQSVFHEICDFDIGVYPLLDNKFNEYKCGFKTLEYMALGIPTVASENPASLDIISDGVDGFFATTQTEWISKLERLIQSKSLREEMGRAGRIKVENEYDIKILAERIKMILIEDAENA